MQGATLVGCLTLMLCSSPLGPLQEQLELACKVDALPALLLAERPDRDLTSPMSTVPRLSMRCMTPSSAAASHLGKCSPWRGIKQRPGSPATVEAFYGWRATRWHAT